MALFFKDRLPDKIYGQNARFYDAVSTDGSIKLSDFKLVLKNNISAANQGEPVSAGNLNFASGNAEFNMAKGQTINKGNLLTLTADGVSPVNIRTRSIAATSSQSNLQTVLKLSNTKLLLIYRSGSGGTRIGTAVIADLNWTSKTVTMGDGYSISDYTTVEVINSTSFCYITYGTNSAALHLCTVSGRVISTGESISLTDGAILSGAMSVSSNPAKMSDNSVLVVHETAGQPDYYAWQYTISGNAFIRGSRLATISKTDEHIMQLVSVNQGQGKFVLFTRNNSTLNYTARTLGFPSVTTLNLGNNNNQFYAMPIGYGGLRYGGADYKPVLMSYNSAGTEHYVWVVNVNSSTGAMSLGTKHTIPGIYYSPNVTADLNGRLIFTGPVYLNGAVETVFYETAIEGTSLIFSEYRPFRNTNLSTGTLNGTPPAPSHVHWGMAIENASNAGEFLFLQYNYTGGVYSTVQFSYGFKGDNTSAINIVGIALENGSNGRVRTQVSGKLIPGLWSGLRTGCYYSAGLNGGLTLHDGTATPIGMAVSENDFIFYGAEKI